MLTMIIADDEKLLLDSLMNYIDWTAMGIRVVAGCSNGIEALEAVMDESPDIVMTDIKMPGLGGLELIERISRMDRDIEFIVLSGYREFSFAQQAIKFGVREYLLKPLDEAQLELAVEAVKKHRMEKAATHRVMAEHKSLFLLIREQKRILLMYDLFSAGRYQAAVKSYITEYGESEGGYHTVYFTFVPRDKVADFVKYVYEVTRLLETDLFFRLLYVTDTVAAVFTERNEKIDAVVAAARDFFAETENDMDIFIQRESTTDLQECVERISGKLTRFAEIWMVDETLQMKELFNEGVTPEKLDRMVKKILECQGTGDYLSAAALIRQYLESIRNASVLRIYGVQIFSRLAMENMCCLEEAQQVTAGFYAQDDPEELVELIVEEATKLLSVKQSADSLIAHIKAYVQQNLSDSDLSLKRIAQEQVYLNVDYLSHLFVQRTGEKFSHYLNMLRVETAKKLMQGESKVYYVAERVGCGNNPRYFSQIFKKYTGMTPTAYVEELRKNGEPPAFSVNGKAM